MKQFSVPFFFICCVSAFPLFHVSASADQLDQSKLIDALSDRGMDELLLHLAETGEFSDAAEPKLIRVGQLRSASRDPQRSAAERLEAFDESRRVLRELIDDPEMANHPLRPVWRTDLAEMLLVTHLQGFRRSAAGYYEFGVPSRDQRAAFEADIPVALAMLMQADTEFRDLESRLTRDTALRDQLDASLATDRIFEEYRDQKSAWFTADAAYLATLLPDDNPYFASLGAAPSQAGTPAAERDRLRELSLRKLGPFLTGDAGGAAVQARAQSLAGRVMLAQGKADAAEREHLIPATSAAATGDWNSDRRDAFLALARAQEAQGNADEARAQLEELAEKSVVRDRLDDRLLVADALHLLLLRQSEAVPAPQRTAQIEVAYGVYFELLDDPALGDSAPAIRNLVYDRWASSLADEADLSALPPAVRMAVADISRRRGMLDLRQGEEEQGKARLQRAIDLGESLGDRAAVGDTVWANAQYNLAYATYAIDPQKLSALLRAADLATAVAEQTPDQTVATDAIDLATRLLESLHRQYASQPGVTPAFERAMKVLYESGNFDTTRPADDRLIYYAYAMFHARGEYEQAAELYDKQLRTHPNYLEAQAQRVAALSQWYAALPSGARREAAEADLLDAAKKVAAAAEPVMKNPPDARQGEAAARALGSARLAQAEVYAGRGNLDRALEEIASFESDFADRPELVRRGLERRLLLLVEAERLDQAQEAAGTMMGRFPDAAAGVINNVLNDMERRIAALGDDSPEAAKLADAAAAMAKLLADWATQQGFEKNQMLPYHLVVLKSLRIADRPDEALAYLRDTGVDGDFTNNVDVLFEKARALVTKGDPASLKAAAPLLNRILGGLTEPYPDIYWRAWIARLQINLLLGERVDEVPRRVRQLQQSHPDLGGEPFKSQLEALAAEAGR